MQSISPNTNKNNPPDSLSAPQVELTGDGSQITRLAAVFDLLIGLGRRALAERNQATPAVDDGPWQDDGEAGDLHG